MNPSQENDLELRIADVVAEWMRLPAKQRWDPAVVAQWVAEHPDLAPGLEECLQGLQRIEAVATLSSGDSDAAPTASQAGYPQIPDFQILGELGRGGMGLVYEARQLSLNRIVALKVLPLGRVDRQAVERFVREAETVAAMRHAGIVPVYAVGVHEGLHWFAMQRIDGMPLSHWLAHHNVASRQEAIADVVRVGIDVAEALDHAHRRGVIHRDVKPGNLLVDADDKVWLTDFGLARREVDVTTTATGTMLGTPRYMSPEQILHREDSIDARTDIYSLGATLYEMVTGQPPFVSESPLQLLNQIQQDEPLSPRQIDPSIPRPLELVIQKCLDKDPDRRYATAGDLANDLRAIRDERPITAQGLPLWVRMQRFYKRHHRPIQSAAAAIAFTCATLVAAIVLWQQTQQAGQGEIRIDTPGGLFFANVQPKRTAAEGRAITAADSPRLVTTPMQATMPLAVGDYTLRMEGTGNVSQLVEVAIKSGQTSDVEYVDRRPQPTKIDIQDKLARAWSAGALAVLGNESLQVFEPGGTLRFSLPVSDLAPVENGETAGTAVDAAQESKVRPRDRGAPLTFAYDPKPPFQGDFDVSHTGFARIERLATKSLDLDADQRDDLLVTAARHAALCAVSHEGQVLWKRHLPMRFEASVQTSRFPFHDMPCEAIVGIQPIADCDGDGTPELLVNAALFDPQGLSRPMLFTLSGRDGRTLTVMEWPTVDMNQVTSWPWSGLLRHRRGLNTQARESRYRVSHYDQIEKFGQLHDLDNLRWGGNSASSALYVLPSPVLTGSIATTVIGQDMHFVDVQTGKPAGPAITLPQPICRGPMLVPLRDEQWGVAVLSGKPSSSFTDCQLSLCVMGETKPRWTVGQATNAYEMLAGAAESSFPMVIDLDQDGESEILTTVNPNSPFASPALECRSGATGKRRWTSAQIIGLGQQLDKALPIGDANQDGVLDLALCNVAGRPAQRGFPQCTVLVIDFICGQSGRRLGYREEIIRSDVREVLEIDELRREGNQLICSLVHGSGDELELSSVSFAFDLTSLRSANSARGLTRLPGGPNSHREASGHWYRQRSGPYAPRADHAVWIPTPVESLRTPKRNLLAAWQTPAGQPRVLLGDNGRVLAVDPRAGERQWEQPSFVQADRIHVLAPPDGEVELLWSDDQYQTLVHHADHGRLQFRLDSPPTRGIYYLALDRQQPQRFAYGLADADGTPAYQPVANAQQGYRLLKIDRQQRSVLWSHPVLPFLDVQRQHLQPSKLLQVDINQDDTLDIILANSRNQDLVLEARDGASGEVIWETPLDLVPDQQAWPWLRRWPQTECISNATGTYIVAIDADPQDDQKVVFKCWDVFNGRLLSTLKDTLRQPLRHSVDQYDLQWSVLAPDAADGLLGLSMVNDKLQYEFVVFHVEAQGQLVVRDRFPTGTTTMTADLDNDGSLERISIEQQTVTIYPAASDQAVSSFELPPAFNLRRIEQVENQHYLVGYNPHAHYWLELPSGEVAVENRDGFDATTINQIQYPRWLAHTEGDLLVGTTPEGPLFVPLRGSSKQSLAANASPPIAMQRPETDLRYLRPIRAVGPYRYMSLAQILWVAILATLALWLPLVYCIRSIRQRQWSLRWFLMAPLLTMLAICSWRALGNLDVGTSLANLFLGTIVSGAIGSVGYLLLKHHWWQLVIGGVVSAVLATLFMFLAEQSLVSRSPNLIGYWTLTNWFAAVLTTASFVMGLAGVLLLRTDKYRAQRGRTLG